MDYNPLEIASLIEESRALIQQPQVAQVEYMWRRCAMYQLLSSQSISLLPAIHLWRPDRSTLSKAVLDYEPGLQGESFWIAVHGHLPVEMCGLKQKSSQLCHMAFFKPYGIEKEAFEKKWNYLYASEQEYPIRTSPINNSDSSLDCSGTGRIRPGTLDFMV